jgi:hypothetical protein
MPATIMHQMFAKDATHILKEVFPFIEKYPKIMALGTQGPDPFFFYGMIPYRKRKDHYEVRMIGSKLHLKDVSRSLETLLKNAFKENLETLKTYALAALLHYTLDRRVHPYVFNQSGFDQQGQLSKPYNLYHSHMETMMDVEMLKVREETSQSYHPAHQIKVDPNIIDQIDLLYYESYSDFAKRHAFKEAVRDMADIYQVIYSPSGRRHQLLKLLLGPFASATAASHPKHIDKKDTRDYLNLKKRTWQNPGNQQSSNLSVVELYQKALDDLKALMPLLDQFQHTHHIHLEPFTMNINYEGILENETMTYQQSIY